MPRRTLIASLLAAGMLAVAGCGGDDDDNAGGSTSGGGNSARPADAILADAGLQVCGEAQDQYVQSIGDEGPQNAQAFAVAEDCGGTKTSPNTLTVYQFDSIDSRDQAATAISAAFDRVVVMTSGALLLISAGPDREANADAVGEAYADSTGAPVTTVQ